MVLETDPDIVLAKVSTIRKCAATIRKLRTLDDPLGQEMLLDLTVLHLQRATQACLDLANHLIAANHWELPRSPRHAFAVLADERVIDAAQLRVLSGLMGFRNVAVHDYIDVDPDIVESIVTMHLGDLEAFGDTLLSLAPGLQGESGGVE